MTPRGALLLVCAVAAVAGCAGGGLPQTHYYTLGPPREAAGAEAAASGGDGLRIGVESFAVDPPYDQDRIVYRASRDASEVGFYAYHRWASPVGRLVQSALVDGLRGARGVGSIEPATSTGDYDARLGGRVLHLEHIDGAAGQEVRVALELELRAGAGTLWAASLEASAAGAPADASKVADLLVQAFDQLVEDARGRLAAGGLAPPQDGRADSRHGRLAAPAARPDEAEPRPTMAALLEASSPSDWQALDPANTLYLELPGGEVVIRLAPEFAPEHVANIKSLVAQRFFDGLAVTRSQENYVVQWGDPAAEGEERRSLGAARSSLDPEFDRPAGGDLALTLLDDPDAYAPQTGFAHGLPIARDPRSDRVWLVHCYAMVGVGRDVAPGSGSGAELYVVIGHSPRHLDRNVSLVGRVVRGMEHLSTLPRGTGDLGFYEDPGQVVPITSVRLGSELPGPERARLEMLRTDTPTFEALIAARRSRHESWFVEPTGRIEVCNVPLPVRALRELVD